jgi:transcriptional regulator with XRE-family HTH domain
MRKSVHTRAYKALREQLIAARKNAGLSQEALAARLGRPQSFVAKYEVGERRIDLIELLAILNVLGANKRRVVEIIDREISG